MVNRRQFLSGLTAAGASVGVGGVSGVALASPALVSKTPQIKWRLTSSFPKTLDTIYEAAQTVSKIVSDATEGRFQIHVFPSNEIVPGLQAADAVSNGSVEMAHTVSYYYVGKDPTFALATSIPFGMNTRQASAWLSFGGGDEMMNAFYETYNLYAFPGGATGCQMGGWFRKEINTMADLKGLKMRIAGLAGRVLEQLGAAPQQIAGGEIYQALEKGTIDAAEWVGPYDDQKLGFYKVAPYYYYPGWWEGGPILHFFLNLDKWRELPKSYQAILKAACAFAHGEMLAKYDAKNPIALKELVGLGAKLRPFSDEILNACQKSGEVLFSEICKKNAPFKKIYDSYQSFKADQYLWFQVAEYTFDNYQIRNKR